MTSRSQVAQLEKSAGQEQPLISDSLRDIALECWRHPGPDTCSVSPADKHLHGKGYYVEQDANGKPRSVIDANGNVTEQIHYGPNGRVNEIDFGDGTSLVSKDGGKTFDSYDAQGNKLPGQPLRNLSVDRDGNISYDNGSEGRVTRCRDGYTVLEFNADKDWRKAAEHAQTIRDSHGRITEVVDQHGHPLREFDYDKNGNLNYIRDQHRTWRKKDDGSWQYQEAGTRGWKDGATPHVNDRGDVSWTIAVQFTAPDGSTITEQSTVTDMIDGRYLVSPWKTKPGTKA